MEKETFTDKKVTYTLEMDGKFYIVENVPARVSDQTGEELFTPETVEQLQQTIWTSKQPKRTIETPIFEFSV